VQVVFDENVFRRPVRLQHRGDDVDVGKVVAPVGQRFHLRVELGLGGQLLDARLRGLGGDEPDRRCAERLVLPHHEGGEIGIGLVRRALGVDVVVAGVEDDFLRLVGRDDAVEIGADLPYRRSTEAAVDHGAVGKVFLQRAPEADGRRPDEERRAFRRHGRLVGRLERRDGLLEAGRGGRWRLDGIGRERGAGGEGQA